MRHLVVCSLLVLVAACAATPIESIVTGQKLQGWKVGSQRDLGRGQGTLVARIIQGNDGRHRIAYAEKGAAMDAGNRAYWMGVLDSAYVAKGDASQHVTLKSE